MPIQKSFSDQNHSAQARQQQPQQWNRVKSVGGAPKTNLDSKPLQEKQPVPVSTATKNKLSVFNFGAQSTTKNASKSVTSLPSYNEKENNESKSRTKNAEEQKDKLPKVSQDQPAIAARKFAPSTPAARLALPDLLGMGDVRRPAQSVSPDERIEWDKKDEVPGSGFGGVRRARKRARSSSPTGSSPAQALSSHPQVDPGSELWGRYSHNGSNAPTPQGPSVPALAQLMHTLSPQPTKDAITPRSGRGFRRANSCGNQFPKRRRTGGSENDDMFTEPAAIGPSKLAVLIESVTEGLSQAPGVNTVHKRLDSYHVSHRRPPSGDKKESPTQRSRLKQNENTSVFCDQASNLEDSKENVLPPLPENEDTDYGEFDDDELDAGLLEIVDAQDLGSIIPPDPPPQRRTVSNTTSLIRQSPPPQWCSITKAMATPTGLEANPPKLPKTSDFKGSPMKAEKDEFGDSDDDMFTEIASQYDAPISVANRASMDRVKATSDSSAPLVYGTILHEIFQSAMLENRWDTEWLGELIEKLALRHLEDLYIIKIEVSHAVEYLKSKMFELQCWSELFVSSQPNPQATVQAGNGETAIMCVSKLLDVEEHVWSPMYGLKGNIDATVQVTMHDGNYKRTLTVPFEVKTGKNPSAAHRAQTALYNLLLSDRYDVEIAYGILYYMETSETIRIPAIRHELRHMIMQRNELACFVREKHTQLPPMLKKENMCNRCYAKVPCFIYHKLADDGNGETSGMKTKFDELVQHLGPKHQEFFNKWDDLLTKEEKETLKFRRELWTMLSSEREKLGRCFSDVVIEPGSAFEEQNNQKINRSPLVSLL
ncbi:hypothetical protein PZA11_007285 [Diplocarpon coronariae]